MVKGDNRKTRRTEEFRRAAEKQKLAEWRADRARRRAQDAGATLSDILKARTAGNAAAYREFYGEDA